MLYNYNHKEWLILKLKKQEKKKERAECTCSSTDSMHQQNSQGLSFICKIFQKCHNWSVSVHCNVRRNLLSWIFLCQTDSFEVQSFPLINNILNVILHTNVQFVYCKSQSYFTDGICWIECCSNDLLEGVKSIVSVNTAHLP